MLDAEFFNHLRLERPYRREEIDAVERAMLGSNRDGPMVTAAYPSTARAV